MAKNLLLTVILLLSSPYLAFSQDKSDKVVDTKFVVVSSFLVSSTVFDIKSTYYFLDNCPKTRRCVEGNILMKPFVDRGKPVLYAVQVGINTGIISYAYYLKKHNNKLWWVVPVVFGASHTIAGTHNLKVALSW